MSKLVERRSDLTLEKLERTRRLMDAAVPDCLVTGYEDLVDTLVLPDPGDRHVLAAAIRVSADVIFTFNVKDFPDAVAGPYGIHTKTPDDFILDLESLHPTTLLDAVLADKAHYQNPPLTFDAYLDDLRKAGIPRVAEFLDKVRVVLEDDDPSKIGS